VDLRARFEAPEPLTIGIEEELHLLDPETLDLLPRATDVLARTGGDPRFKLEMMASQLEIVTPPARSVPEAIAALASSRRDLAAACEGFARLAGIGCIRSRIRSAR
jgi:carboxylate-amine ligase